MYSAAALAPIGLIFIGNIHKCLIYLHIVDYNVKLHMVQIKMGKNINTKGNRIRAKLESVTDSEVITARSRLLSIICKGGLVICKRFIYVAIYGAHHLDTRT